MKSIDMVLLFDFYGDMLTDKQREFFDRYYNEDLSLAEIAENEGITRQGVRDAILRAETAMTELEGKLHLYRRFGGAQDCLERIVGFAQEILDTNDRNFRNQAIDACAREIIAAAESLPISEEFAESAAGAEPAEG